MSDGPTPRDMSTPATVKKPVRKGKRPQAPTRRLSFRSRMRGKVRDAANRVLAADFFWSGTFVIVTLGLLGSQNCASDLPDLRAGELAPFDVRAPVSFTDTNGERTDERRLEAESAVLEIYVWDKTRGMRLDEQLAELFAAGRSRIAEPTAGEADPDVSPVDPLASDPAVSKALEATGYDPALELDLRASLNHVMSGRIVTNRMMLGQQPAITLIASSDGVRQRVEEFSTFQSLSDARQLARETVERRLKLPEAREQALGNLVASFVDANVLPDAVATKQARDAAARLIQPWREYHVKGEVLIREGAVITEKDLRTLHNARRAMTGGLNVPFLASLLFVTSMMAFFIYRYSSYQQRHFRKIEHLHALMVLMLVSTLTLSRAILWLASEVVDALSGPFNQLSWYAYLVPLGAGSILLTLLANGRIAIVYSSFVALLFGAMNGWNPWLMFWAMLVQCAGVYAISTDRERSAALRAGLIVGVMGAVSVLAVEGLQSGPPLSGVVYGAALAFVGGALGVGLLISFTLPILESLFNVLTDIRLLELSNVNNPLLSQLAIQAPGSYNHSLVVGTLAEEGAKAIGASSLFCRVAAFYHDIGKMEKPEYYVENQRGVNPHDRLSPSMSALIIASHVKDGIKLAREAGLPEQIVDIIPQHHGTKLMKYFYERARSAGAAVKEEDFRYPGPKPQTREGAIFMLADSVEAAARTVGEPTPNRLRDVIQQISNSIVVDGQLEECDLTFADLQRIQDAFHRLLVSMYHHRVDYPGFDFNRPKDEVPAVDEDPSERHVARTS